MGVGSTESESDPDFCNLQIVTVFLTPRSDTPVTKMLQCEKVTELGHLVPPTPQLSAGEGGAQAWRASYHWDQVSGSVFCLQPTPVRSA